jgi:hypothetical protein
MKTNYLLVLICLMLCLSACKKANVEVAVNPSDIVGKWYENKLNVSKQLISGGAVTDTTYLSNSFTTADYFQFNSDSTAIISSSGGVLILNDFVFEVFGGGVNGGQLYFQSYTLKNSTLTLRVAPIPTASNGSQPGPISETILQLDANNLVIQGAQDTSKNYKVTTVTYYKKGN